MVVLISRQEPSIKLREMDNLNPNTPSPEQGPDKDRLIDTLHDCFSNLIKKQEEQTDRLHRAVEALKVQVPVVDKKMVFWNSYMKLADEHDKELDQKYGTDLDTSLIFAGLFSAVSSAFIIQIESQVVPGAKLIIVVAQGLLYISLFTTLLAALLAVLGKQWIMFYVAAGSRGTVEERGLERQRKLDGLRKWRFDMVLQSFPLLLQLAMLLFSTALSIYLWTVNHAIAIIVLVLTSSGFVGYIFLLASAIIFPDSPFQTPLAASLKQLIPNKYVRMRWGNRFRNFKWHMGWYSSHMTRLRGLPAHAWALFAKSATHILPCFASQAVASTDHEPKAWDTLPDHYFSGPSREVPAVLWVLETTTDPAMIDAAAAMAVELTWPINTDISPPTSTLGEMFSSCFDTTNGWVEPLCKVRPGMMHRAINCGIAWCSLRHLGRASKKEPNTTFILMACGTPVPSEDHDDGDFSQIVNIFKIVQEWPVFDHDSQLPVIHDWTLHTIPSLHLDRHFDSLQSRVEYFLHQFPVDMMPTLAPTGFANYLCCLNSFFGPVSPRIMIEPDKRECRVALITQILIALRTTDCSSDLIMKVVNTTAVLWENMGGDDENPGHPEFVRTAIAEVSRFCDAFPRVPGWFEVVISAVSLVRVKGAVRVRAVQSRTHDTGIKPRDTWIYNALEHVQRSWEDHLSSSANPDRKWDDNTTATILGLLQVLACNDTGELVASAPPLPSLHIILRALSVPGTVSATAFLVLYARHRWFLEPTLQPVMHAYSIWPRLGEIALEFPPFASNYIAVGASISTSPEWKPVIFTDLVTWITAFGDTNWWSGDTVFDWGDEMFKRSRKGFISVICNVWVPDSDEGLVFADDTEKSAALALSALANVWEAFDWSVFTDLHELVGLIRCTISTALPTNAFNPHNRRNYNFDAKQITHAGRTIIAPQLVKSLTDAAKHARDTLLDPRCQISTSTGSGESRRLRHLADLLELMSHTIGSPPS
ncbi:hypothetical protein MVEN_00959400 [Mycena venus]|uniref:DUF6535 domain-containing protein n=1 Tax=Mycena venus TaxID=2733690 RepID=A0A8H7D244_9AGAR|nr:hypothetical protein MVEN_00959400 [Mycena venus]